MGMFDDLVPEAPAKASGSFDDLIPKQKTTANPSGLVRSVRDVQDAGAQLLYNILPKPVRDLGDTANNWIAEKTGLVAKLPDGGLNEQIKQQEADYQSQRAASGETGLDGDRLAGNVALSVVPGIGATKAAAALKFGKLGQAAASGAASATLNPVTDGGDTFFTDKAIQAAGGAAAGAGTQKALGALSRVISPKASVNPDVQALRGEGVDLSIGQTLGGFANTMEQKLQSLPIVGDAIKGVREGAREQFQNRTINQAVAPIGGSVDGVGHGAVSSAGNQLSAAYKSALDGIKGVKFDGQFASELGNLRQMTQSLTPDMQRKFEKVLQDEVMGRMSQAPGMAAETFKKADSVLGIAANRHGKSLVASEQELGDAFKELQRIVRDQVARQNPQYASALNDANSGWAALARIEKAAAKNAESGEFTPKQLLQAIRESDGTVRRRGTARGDALMQDWAAGGSRVLSETVPNSGTVDRLLPVATGGAAIANPLLAGGALAAGYGAYLPIIQRLLTGAVAARPQAAQAVANQVTKSAPLLAIPSSAFGRALIEE